MKFTPERQRSAHNKPERRQGLLREIAAKSKRTANAGGAQPGFIRSASRATIGQLAIDDHGRNRADAERPRAFRHSAVAHI